MPDESIVTQLNLLDHYVDDLCQIQPHSLGEFQNDKMLRRYTERMLHMAIDTCIQIGIGVLTQAGCRSPENYHDIFIVLGEHNLLPQHLVDCMTALVEFRNLLVYEHGEVDDIMVYGFAKRRLEDFTEFAACVRTYLAQPDLVNPQ